jgi:drug/metabolite transporter (DMT)-like permease
MLAILLALCGSISLGAADFTAGFKARQVRLLPVIVVSQFAGLAALLPAMAVVGGAAPDTARFWIFAAIAGIAQFLGVIAFWRSLEIGVMGIVAPISALSALLPVGVGLASGDRPAALQLVGIGLAFAGVIMTAYDGQSSERPDTRIAAGVGLALLGAIGVGLFPVAIDAAADEGSALWAVFASRVCSCAVTGVGLVVLRKRLGVGRVHLPALAAVGVLEIAGLLLVAAATTHGLLTIVGVITSLYPVTTVALAWLLLHERLHIVQRTGAVIAMAGIVAVTAASG